MAALGISACAMGRAQDLYARDGSLTMAVVATWASMLGIIAVIAIVVALVTADPTALATLFAVTVTLWATATVRHALTAPDGLTSGTADTSEPFDANPRLKTSQEPDAPAAVQHRPDALPSDRGQSRVEAGRKALVGGRPR